MPVFELLALLLGAAVVWLWMDSIRVRELAVHAAFQACADDGVQLLDETVAIRSLGLARDGDGKVCLVRKYGFEFSDTGENRRSGWLVLRGQEIEALHLQTSPYPIQSGSFPDSSCLRLGQDGQQLAAESEEDGSSDQRPFDRAESISCNQPAGQVRAEQKDIEA